MNVYIYINLYMRNVHILCGFKKLINVVINNTENQISCTTSMLFFQLNPLNSSHNLKKLKNNKLRLENSSIDLYYWRYS